MPDEFGKLMAEAQGADRTESRFGQELERELDQHIPGAAKKPKFRYHCQTFTVFRPWQECHRCQRDFRPRKDAHGDWQDPVLVMNEGEDFRCPHNENKQYVDLVNRLTNGELRLIQRSLESLKNGVIQALVEWGEPLTPTKKEESKPFLGF